MKGHIEDFTLDFYIEKRKNKQKKSKERETQYTAHSSRMFSAVISDKCFFRDIYLCRREKSNEIYAAVQKINQWDNSSRREHGVYKNESAYRYINAVMLELA